MECLSGEILPLAARIFAMVLEREAIEPGRIPLARLDRSLSQSLSTD